MTIELNKIYTENALDTMARMPDEFIDCVVPSPPYYGLRSYDCEPAIWGGDSLCDHVWGFEQVRKTSSNFNEGFNERWGNSSGQKKQEASSYGQVSQGTYCQLCNAWRGQLGLEPTFQRYIAHLIDIFREVKRVLKPTGTVWVNLGDSFNGAKQGNTEIYKNPNLASDSNHKKLAQASLQIKSLMNIPYRFAIAMTDELGFIQRNQVNWFKRACMPSSAKDRFTVDFEPIFFFTKSKKYYFEQQIDAYTAPLDRWGGIELKANGHSMWDEGTGQSQYRDRNMRPNPDGRNKRTTWDVPYEPSNEGVKTDRLRLAEADAAPYDTRRIAFPDCPTCAGLIDRVSTALCDEPQADMLTRIARIDGYLAHERVFGFDPFVKNLVLDSGAYSCGSFVREYFHSATWRNKQNHKTVRDLLTSLSYTAFVKTLESIDDRLDGLLLSVLYFGIHGSSISLDGLDAHLLDKIPSYIPGKSEIACSSCQIYQVKTEITNHFASYPTKLIETPILAGCPESGIVYEPFCGTGTTCLVAHRLGRNWIGSELSEKYTEIANRRLEPYLMQEQLF